MAISIIIHIPTGRRLREGIGTNAVVVVDPTTEEYVELVGFNDIPPETTHRWNTTLKTFESYSSLISRTRITREEFWDKFTDNELEKLHELRIDPAGVLLTRVRLETIKMRLETRDYVNLANAKVITAVTWMVGQLANAGLITDTAPARNARVAAILAPLTIEEPQ